MTTALSNGAVAFQDPIKTPVDGSPISILTADFNHDGNSDLAASAVLRTGPISEQSVLQIYLGNGDGTFRAPLTYNAPCASPPLQAKSAALDLALVCAEAVAVFRGFGDGTFDAPVTTASRRSLFVYAIGMADFDVDGNLDRAIPGGNPTIPIPDSTSATGGVTVLFGKGDGTFRPPGRIGSGAVTSILVTDCNVDGVPEASSSRTARLPKMGRCLLAAVTGRSQLVYRCPRILADCWVRPT